MKLSLLPIVLACAVPLIACGSDDDGANTNGQSPDPDSAGEIPVPAQSGDVQTTYDRIGNACNDSSLTRSFGVVGPRQPDDLWSAPDADPAALRASKVSGRWGQLAEVSLLDFNGTSENFQTTSPEQLRRCGSARELFTPLGDGARRSSLNLLIYAGDHPHLSAVPEGTAASVDAPVRLRGYLDFVSGTREVIDDGVLYSDVVHQHVPLYLQCDKPMRVAYDVLETSSDEYRGLDPSACRARRGEGGGYDCIYERLEQVPNNRCTFVAVDATFKAANGTEQKLSLGGKFETIEGAPARYRMTVDRYAFESN